MPSHFCCSCPSNKLGTAFGGWERDRRNAQRAARRLAAKPSHPGTRVRKGDRHLHLSVCYLRLEELKPGAGTRDAQHRVKWASEVYQDSLAQGLNPCTRLPKRYCLSDSSRASLCFFFLTRRLCYCVCPCPRPLLASSAQGRVTSWLTCPHGRLRDTPWSPLSSPCREQNCCCHLVGELPGCQPPPLLRLYSSCL